MSLSNSSRLRTPDYKARALKRRATEEPQSLEDVSKKYTGVVEDHLQRCLVPSESHAQMLRDAAMKEEHRRKRLKLSPEFTTSHSSTAKLHHGPPPMPAIRFLALLESKRRESHNLSKSIVSSPDCPESGESPHADMKEAHRQLRERRRYLLDLTGSTYQQLISRDISHFTINEMHAFRRVAEATTRLEKLHEARASRIEQNVPARESQEEPDRTAYIFEPVVRPSPPSGNILVDADKALKAARYALKQAQTVFELVSGMNITQARQMSSRNMLLNKRQKELYEFVIKAEIELTERQSEVTKSQQIESWIERYGNEKEALRHRRMARREAKKLARPHSRTEDHASVDIALAVRQKVNVFDIQNMLDQSGGS